jgi:hypothetical protein
MKRGVKGVRWRNILWIGPTAAFGLIIALHILLSTYDYNSLRPRIERAVRDATGLAAETIAKAVGGIVLFLVRQALPRHWSGAVQAREIYAALPLRRQRKASRFPSWKSRRKSRACSDKPEKP